MDVRRTEIDARYAVEVAVGDTVVCRVSTASNRPKDEVCLVVSHVLRDSRNAPGLVAWLGRVRETDVPAISDCYELGERMMVGRDED